LILKKYCEESKKLRTKQREEIQNEAAKKLICNNNIYKTISSFIFMKKIAILFFGIFLISFTLSLELVSEYDTNVIIKDLDTAITLTLTITDAPDGLYNVYTLADMSMRPTEMFTIDQGDIVKNFILKPTENLDVEGYYSFTYTLNHRDVEKIDRKLTVKILNLKDVLEIYSDEINYEEGEITLTVKNKEDILIEDLDVEISSVLFNEKKTISLNPLDEEKIKIKVDKEALKKTTAGIYIINSIFETAEGEKKIEGKLYLGEKRGISVTEDRSGFFIYSYVINKQNIGNTLETVKVEIDKNIFSRLFTSFNIEPNLVERNGFNVHYTWIKNRLEPGESLMVRARTNYILPFIVIAVLVLAFFGIKRFTETKVEVVKSVFPVKTKNGEFALKITLSVKAKKNSENLTLIDRVPGIVKIYNKFGTIKPSRIDTQSRRIHWNIGNLNAGEVRLFSYIVYSKVGVVGKFSLPEAVVVFEKDGKIHEVESNQVFFMNEQVKKD